MSTAPLPPAPQPLTAEQHKTLARTELFLIAEGQKHTVWDDFQRQPFAIGWYSILVLCVCIAFSLAVSSSAREPSGIWTSRAFWDNWSHYTAPVALGAFLAFVAAAVYTQWRQKKDVAFQLIQELNSREFEKTRLGVVSLARISHTTSI